MNFCLCGALYSVCSEAVQNTAIEVIKKKLYVFFSVLHCITQILRTMNDSISMFIYKREYWFAIARIGEKLNASFWFIQCETVLQLYDDACVYVWYKIKKKHFIIIAKVTWQWYYIMVIPYYNAHLLFTQMMAHSLIVSFKYACYYQLNIVNRYIHFFMSETFYALDLFDWN